MSCLATVASLRDTPERYAGVAALHSAKFHFSAAVAVNDGGSGRRPLDGI